MASPEPRDRMIRRLRTGEPVPEMATERGQYQDLLWEAVVRSEARSEFQFQALRSREPHRPPGKENVPPGRPTSTSRRRSALPVWYPRTPLRDVTAVMNALERRRTSLRLEARRRRLSGRVSSTPGPTACGLDSSSSPLILAVASSVDGESSPRTPSVASADDSKLQELEMKLEKSIEVIEKAIKENMRRMPKLKKDVQGERVRSLRSMR